MFKYLDLSEKGANKVWTITFVDELEITSFN